jgi:hypothetical protein
MTKDHNIKVLSYLQEPVLGTRDTVMVALLAERNVSEFDSGP